MYYQNYEDYMRSILGYPIETGNTYEMYQYPMTPFENTQVYSNTNRYSDEIVNLYPEIYKIINPMVCKICDSNTKPITRELIDQMTDEIYMNIEEEPEIDTIINETMNRTIKENENKETSKTTRDTEKENRQRRPNNRILRDLIRILILNRLLGGFFPNRPNFPPRPNRPPIRPPFPREDRFGGHYF